MQVTSIAVDTIWQRFGKFTSVNYDEGVKPPHICISGEAFTNHFKTASDEATCKLLAHTFRMRMMSCERAGRARGRDDWTKVYRMGLASRPSGRANWGTNDREQETMSAF